MSVTRCSFSVLTGAMIVAVIYRIVLSLLYYACFVEEILAVAPAVKAGAYATARYTKDQYLKTLDITKTLLWSWSVISRDERVKTAYSRVASTEASLKLDSSDGSLRKQPFCIMLEGFPGTGKTGTALNLASVCMKALHGEFRKEDVVILNESDEFQSEFRTSHRVVIFDDIAAENPNNSTINPWRKVIDFVNNIRKTALNPNVDLKGNVYIEPDLVILTTNMSYNETSPYGAHAWLNCPRALQRRISLVVELLPGFERCNIHRESMVVDGSTTRCYGQTTTFKKEEISLEQLYLEVRGKFLTHHKEQEEFVNRMNQCFDGESQEKVIYEAQSGVESIIDPKRRYLDLCFNSDAFLVYREELEKSKRAWFVLEDGFCLLPNKECSLFVLYTLPVRITKEDHNNTIFGHSYTYNELEDYYTSIKSTQSNDLTISEDGSDDEKSLLEGLHIQHPNEVSEVYRKRLVETEPASKKAKISVLKDSKSMKKALSLHQKVEEWLNEDYFQNPLEKSIYLANLLALAANAAGATDIELEPRFEGRTPDIILMWKGNAVIGETKYRGDYKAQITEYMEISPDCTYGFGMNRHGYAIYSKGKPDQEFVKDLSSLIEGVYASIHTGKVGKCFADYSEVGHKINCLGPYV